MTRTIAILALTLTLGVGEAAAEYLELEATQFVTIAPVDDSTSARILVQWTLPEGLDTLIIDAAAVTMTLDFDAQKRLAVDVYPVTRSWTAADADWSEGWTKAGGDYIDSLASPAMATEGNGGRITADVYDLVRDQIAGRCENFGFIVIPSADTPGELKTSLANDEGKLADTRLIIAYRVRR